MILYSIPAKNDVGLLHIKKKEKELPPVTLMVSTHFGIQRGKGIGHLKKQFQTILATNSSDCELSKQIQAERLMPYASDLLTLKG